MRLPVGVMVLGLLGCGSGSVTPDAEPDAGPGVCPYDTQVWAGGLFAMSVFVTGDAKGPHDVAAYLICPQEQPYFPAPSSCEWSSSSVYPCSGNELAGCLTSASIVDKASDQVLDSIKVGSWDFTADVGYVGMNVPAGHTGMLFVIEGCGGRAVIPIPDKMPVAPTVTDVSCDKTTHALTVSWTLAEPTQEMWMRVGSFECRAWANTGRTSVALNNGAPCEGLDEFDLYAVNCPRLVETGLGEALVFSKSGTWYESKDWPHAPDGGPPDAR